MKNGQTYMYKWKIVKYAKYETKNFKYKFVLVWNKFVCHLVTELYFWW
jgi:hypothetical protein